MSRGQEFLAKGFTAEAEKEFRPALALTPSNAEAHSGLAHALEETMMLPERARKPKPP